VQRLCQKLAHQNLLGQARQTRQNAHRIHRLAQNCRGWPTPHCGVAQNQPQAENGRIPNSSRLDLRMTQTTNRAQIRNRLPRLAV